MRLLIKTISREQRETGLFLICQNPTNKQLNTYPYLWKILTQQIVDCRTSLRSDCRQGIQISISVSWCFQSCEYSVLVETFSCSWSVSTTGYFLNETKKQADSNMFLVTVWSFTFRVSLWPVCSAPAEHPTALGIGIQAISWHCLGTLVKGGS